MQSQPKIIITGYKSVVRINQMTSRLPNPIRSSTGNALKNPYVR